MAYTPYYPGGWQSGEQGGTPITPVALNNMEAGIGAALTAGDVVDSMTSTATDKPLSANMGKALNEAIAQSTAKSTSSANVEIYTGNITAYVNKLLKCAGLVYAFLEVETTSGQTLTTDDAFARIPSGWRPKVTEEFPASILQSNGTWATYKVSIGTNGDIKQYLTNSAKGVSFVAVYEHA